MAGKQGLANESRRSAPADAEQASNKGGLVGAVIMGTASVIAKVWNAVMADGMLAAAGRQGIDELGAALKAFPDSIQVQESGQSTPKPLVSRGWSISRFVLRGPSGRTDVKPEALLSGKFTSSFVNDWVFPH